MGVPKLNLVPLTLQPMPAIPTASNQLETFIAQLAVMDPCALDEGDQTRRSTILKEIEVDYNQHTLKCNILDSLLNTHKKEQTRDLLETLEWDEDTPLILALVFGMNPYKLDIFDNLKWLEDRLSRSQESTLQTNEATLRLLSGLILNTLPIEKLSWKIDTLLQIEGSILSHDLLQALTKILKVHRTNKAHVDSLVTYAISEYFALHPMNVKREINRSFKSLRGSDDASVLIRKTLILWKKRLDKSEKRRKTHFDAKLPPKETISLDAKLIDSDLNKIPC